MTTLYARLIAIAALLLALWGGYSYVTGLQAERDTLKTENIVLLDRVKIQNEAVLSLKKNADRRQEEAKASLEAAAKLASKAKSDAKAYYAAKPSTPANQCKSALDLINETAPLLGATK